MTTSFFEGSKIPCLACGKLCDLYWVESSSINGLNATFHCIPCDRYINARITVDQRYEEKKKEEKVFGFTGSSDPLPIDPQLIDSKK